MKYIFHFLLLILLPSFSSCVKKEGQDLSLRERNYNISYGSDTAQKLDLFLPKNRDGNTPFAILIHGGGWMYNDKSDLTALQDSLLKRGVASVSINYRYASAQIHFEELMQDVDLAVNYCNSKSDAWNIRKDDYLLGGTSAGGHMSLLYAYNYDEAGRIGGIISAAGPTDITQVDWLNYAIVVDLLDEIENMVGAKYTSGQPLDARFSMASPRFHIKNVPTLILHGSSDLFVPFSRRCSTPTSPMQATRTNWSLFRMLVTIWV
jgi:acetyl esterase/lipase